MWLVFCGLQCTALSISSFHPHNSLWKAASSVERTAQQEEAVRTKSFAPNGVVSPPYLSPPLSGLAFPVRVFFFLIFFSRPHPWHMKLPRLGVAAGLYHSHNHLGSQAHLRPTPQIPASTDLYPTERGQGSNPQSQAS